MPSPFNAAIVYANLADAAMLTASSAVPLAPVDRLKGPHVARKWRSATNAGESILVTFAAPTALDTVALMGLSLGAAGTARVRFSNGDASGQAGEVYDSGGIPAAVDPRYASFVHLLPALRTGRYLRIDLTDPGADYIEAGRLLAGQRYQFAYNFTPGWTRGYVDRSRKTESRGGQTYVDADVSYRSVSVSFDAVPESDRFGFVEEIDRINGTHADILLITRADSPNLGRDSIWGLVSDLDPVGQPQLAWIGSELLYSKSYRITERL